MEGGEERKGGGDYEIVAPEGNVIELALVGCQVITHYIETGGIEMLTSDVLSASAWGIHVDMWEGGGEKKSRTFCSPRKETSIGL